MDEQQMQPSNKRSLDTCCVGQDERCGSRFSSSDEVPPIPTQEDNAASIPSSMGAIKTSTMSSRGSAAGGGEHLRCGPPLKRAARGPGGSDSNGPSSQVGEVISRVYHQENVVHSCETNRSLKVGRTLESASSSTNHAAATDYSAKAIAILNTGNVQGVEESIALVALRIGRGVGTQPSGADAGRAKRIALHGRHRPLTAVCQHQEQNRGSPKQWTLEDPVLFP